AQRVAHWVRVCRDVLRNSTAASNNNATNSNAPSASSSSEHAVFSGKPLLRDMTCLSCEQPLPGLDMDRGAALHGNAMTRMVAASPAYMFAQAPTTFLQ